MNIFIDEEATALLAKLEDIGILFTKVEYFTPNARFSEANFSHITSINFILTSSLFSITAQQLCEATDFIDILNKIKPENFVQGSTQGPLEKEPFLSIVDNLLCLMGERVHLALSYTKDLDQRKVVSPNIDVLHIGIGSKETLHGYPDCKVRGKHSNIHIVFPCS